MRTRSLLNQVLAVNAALVASTAFVAVLLSSQKTNGLLLIVLAVVSAVALNSLLLKRRLVPLETLPGRDHYEFGAGERPPWQWSLRSTYPGWSS